MTQFVDYKITVTDQSPSLGASIKITDQTVSNPGFVVEEPVLASLPETLRLYQGLIGPQGPAGSDDSANKIVAWPPSPTDVQYPSAKLVYDTFATYQPLDAQLTDLASLSYAANGLKVVRVNAGGTGFELATDGGGVKFTDSDTPPGAPVDGDEWFEKTSGVLWTWLVDGDGGQWVDLSGSGTSLTTATITAALGYTPANAADQSLAMLLMGA